MDDSIEMNNTKSSFSGKEENEAIVGCPEQSSQSDDSFFNVK